MLHFSLERRENQVVSTTDIDESDMICLYHIRKSCSFQGKWAKTSWVKRSLFLICDVNATISHHILRIMELDHLGWIQSLLSTEMQNEESLYWWLFMETSTIQKNSFPCQSGLGFGYFQVPQNWPFASFQNSLDVDHRTSLTPPTSTVPSVEEKKMY